MIFALDTNVIIDILYDDENFSECSRKILEQKSEEGFFVISPEVYSELISAFSLKIDSGEDTLEKFLDDKQIVLKKHNRDSLNLAGKKWADYEHSKEVECPNCGHRNNFKCEKCDEHMRWRNHLITDFMIGAHAEETADALITRDRGYFRKYFEIEIIDPSNMN